MIECRKKFVGTKSEEPQSCHVIAKPYRCMMTEYGGGHRDVVQHSLK